MKQPAVAGAILAGGRSRRMAGGDKALVRLAGKPLLQHVIDRVAPQVDALALSVETPSAALAAFALPQLPDPAPGHRGPLGGLLSALRHFSTSHEWLLLAPCDAPFLPLNLAARLHARAAQASVACAVSLYEGELQPVFSIWHRSVLAQLAPAVECEGQSGFKQFMRGIPYAECCWPPADPPPFFNINDEAAMAWARGRSRRLSGELSPC